MSPLKVTLVRFYVLNCSGSISGDWANFSTVFLLGTCVTICRFIERGQLPCTSIQLWKPINLVLWNISNIHLLAIYFLYLFFISLLCEEVLIHSLLWKWSVSLFCEESLCKSLILPFNTVILSLASPDVQRSWNKCSFTWSHFRLYW